jgi:hypothetical protein
LTSWYAHQLPRSIHYWATAGMFVIELAVPWLIFAPPRFRRVRLAACALMMSLQIGIAATGNYGFFNLLTMVLYVALLDDGTLERVLPRHSTRNGASRAGPQPAPAARYVGLAASTIAIGIGVLSALTFFREIDGTRGRRGPMSGDWADVILASVATVNSINGYGLFRVMTTERPEIVLEVSEDGSAWKEYEFRWKTGDVQRRPRFVQPHMPRLDWQMWFAALDPRSAQVWLAPFLERLLAGETAVTNLLGPNPLSGRPRYARLAYYQYRFTARAERAQTGAWWKREFVAYLTRPIGPR